MQGIDYDYILNSKDTASVVKDLVREVKAKGQYSVGEWLKKLATSDIEYLALCIGSIVDDPKFGILNKLTDPDRPPSLGASREQFRTAIVLVDVLASAEGLDPIMFPSAICKKRIKLLDTYLTFEKIKRKGVGLKIGYSNLTLNEDIGDVLTNKSIIDFEPESKDKLKAAVDKAMTGLRKGGKDAEDALDNFLPDVLGEEDAEEFDESKITVVKIDPITGARIAVSEDELPEDIKNQLKGVRAVMAAAKNQTKHAGTPTPDKTSENPQPTGVWQRLKGIFTRK